MKDLLWRRGWFSAFAPPLIWTAVVFFLSSPEGASDQTSRIIGPLLHLVFPSITPESEQFVHLLVRKCAHLTEYFVLSMLWLRCLYLSGIKVKSLLFYILPVAIVFATAPIDEFNQSFEPSRTSSVWDVALDVAGGAIAVLVVAFFARRTRADAMG